MLADRIDQLGPGQTARVDGLLNVLDFLRGELASGQNLWRSVSDQHAAAPKRPPYHLKTVFACPLLFCDKKFLQVGLSCSNFTGSRTMRQSCCLALTCLDDLRLREGYRESRDSCVLIPVQALLDPR